MQSTIFCKPKSNSFKYVQIVQLLFDNSKLITGEGVEFCELIYNHTYVCYRCAFPPRLILYSMYSLKPWTRVEGRCKGRKVMMSFRLTFTTLPLTLLDPCPMVCQLSQHPLQNSLSATIWAQDKVVFAFSQIICKNLAWSSPVVET